MVLDLRGYVLDSLESPLVSQSDGMINCVVRYMNLRNASAVFRTFNYALEERAIDLNMILVVYVWSDPARCQYATELKRGRKDSFRSLRRNSRHIMILHPQPVIPDAIHDLPMLCF